MRAAAVQMTSGPHKELNLAVASALVERAASDGAGLVVLPEMFNCLGSGAELRAGAEPFDGPTATWASDLARRHGIALVAGSFVETAAPAGSGADTRHFNTCRVFDASGEPIAAYRKIHLFDVDVPGAVYHESDTVAPGSEIVVATVCTGYSDRTDDPGAAGSIGVGLSICYDLRFPELFRIVALRGASIVSLPAAFTATTGPPHWEILVRARAIENQVFVVAADQCGFSNDKLGWHGHSMIVDPWGTVLARAADVGSDGPDCRPGAPGSVIVADLDMDEEERVRGLLPSLANRQPSAYVWPPEPGSTAPRELAAEADPPG